MISQYKLDNEPYIFKSLTGMTLTEFEELLEKLHSVWRHLEYQRLNRPSRQRAIGGGGDYKLALREQLLMTLVWLRLSLNTEALGFFLR